jgi:hypothetical protein
VVHFELLGDLVQVLSTELAALDRVPPRGLGILHSLAEGGSQRAGETMSVATSSTCLMSGFLATDIG